MTELPTPDPADVMRRHVNAMHPRNPHRICEVCVTPWPCETYLLAAELARVRASRPHVVGGRLPGMTDEQLEATEDDVEVATWSVRVVRTPYPDDDSFSYNLREVYTHQDGIVTAWTADSVGPHGDSLEEVRTYHQWVADALARPVLTERVVDGKEVLVAEADTSGMSDSVSENSKSSGEAKPMAEAPANPTDAQKAEQEKQKK